MSRTQKSGPAAVKHDGSPQGGASLSSDKGGYGPTPQIRALAVLLVLSMGLMLGLLYWSAKAQDEILIQGSKQLANTALAIQEKTLRNILTDYSYWDEAYENISENFNPDWFYEIFGDYPYLTDYFSITSSFIVAPGNVVLAYTRDGKRGDDAQHFDLSEASGLIGLIDTARRIVDGEFREASGLIEMDGQLGIAATRMVLPYSKDLLEKAGVTPQNGNVAIVVQPLDQTLLDALSDDFGFIDLGYTRTIAEPDQLSVPLHTVDGDPLGFLTWHVQRPSHRVFSVVLPVLVTVIVIIGLLAWHLLSIIRNGQQSLFAAMQGARAANRAKSEFLATISHELRTPMNGVVGIAEILKRGELTGDQRMLLDHLSTSANEQLAIVNDLLDITRLEGGRLELNAEEFDPASIVRAAVTLIRSKADEKGLDLQVALPEGETAIVIGDPGRFKQIVLNLLSNAVKFTKNGKVTVVLATKTAGNSEEIVFSVADTGIGIGQEDQARIFDRFTQADSSTTRVAEGSGLGLAICKGLVDAMQGTIQLTSTLGEGTKVRVHLNLPHAVSPRRRQALHHDQDPHRR